MTVSPYPSHTASSRSKTASIAGVAFDVLLILLILAGVTCRFLWTNWSQGTNLHPDEYGLTNTLTQLSIPKSFGDYLNTRISTISPYDKYDLNGLKIQDGPDNSLRWGQLPIILLRGAAELTGNTGYDEQRLLGRRLSALADTISLLLLFLIGRRLWNARVALLATAFSAMAVLQIQQSHFMTVDNFALVFAMLTMYLAVRIAQQPGLVRAGAPTGEYRPLRSAWGLYALFGMAFGMTLASRINLLPLAGMVLVAAFLSAADLTLRTRRDLERIALYTAAFLAISGAAALLTFRLTQPMSFRAPIGDTTLLTLHINPTWLNSMQQASQESNGIGGGPPQEQWANRPAIIFPLENLVLWGMGLPLGLAGWIGLAWAAWQVAKGKNWRAHLLPLVWTGGYFLFMATRWVKSIRYFLPIYPFLALFAAWALVAWWQKVRERAAGRRRSTWRLALPGLAAVVVTLGTLAWAAAFVQADYLADPTRIQATRWILHNIPGPFEVTVATAGGPRGEPVSAPDGLVIEPGAGFAQDFTVDMDGPLTQVAVPFGAASSGAPARLRIQVASDPQGAQVLGETTLKIGPAQADPRGGPFQAAMKGAQLHAGTRYYLLATALDAPVQISRVALSNETWDEGLPVRIDGYDPFGQFYTGYDMEIRWSDNPDKRQQMLTTLSKADYVILPSQRAIWASSRIPLTYPMTMAYYRALFNGSLGFQQAAHFEAPMHIGPLYISDLAGRVAWGHAPALPLFNYSQIAAEEAFSVYDHPPVWIFAKSPTFTDAQLSRVFDSVDLSKVVVQSPKDATPPEKLGIHE
jgi:4-amino-4-deoxy-L-arabinose transferase-like glycosyltransferase